MKLLNKELRCKIISMNIGFLGLGKLGLPVSLAVEIKGIMFLDLISLNKQLRILKIGKFVTEKNGWTNIYLKQNCRSIASINW